MAVRQKKPWGRIKPSVGYGVDWSDPISKGLLEHWLFNEGAGNTAFNIARKNHGTMNGGVSWKSSGKFGRSLNFTAASGQWISASGTPPALPATICAWINPTTLPSFTGFVSTHSNDNGGFRVGMNGSNLTMTFGTVADYQSTVTATTGSWQLIVCTISGNNGTRTMYRYSSTGVLTSETVAVGTPAGNTTYAIGIGNGTYFDGQIDNVRIYNRALTATEVNRLYTEPFAGVETPKRRWLNSTAAVVVGNPGEEIFSLFN